MGKRTETLSAVEALAHAGVKPHPVVQAFREDMVIHTRFQDGLDQLAERVQFGEQQSITAVIAPPAAGKTALVREFSYQFELAMAKVEPEVRSTLLCMELAAPEHGAFKWKDDCYIPGLVAMDEPCVTKKVNIEALRRRIASGDTRSVFGSRAHTASEYRNMFYDALERCRVAAVLFDEADHLRRPISTSSIFTQYDSLKSRSNACAAHFVLLGTTALADIFSQSGQISKRVYPLWLAPYEPTEMKVFGSAVLAIVEKLGVSISFDVRAKLGELYDKAFGLFGLVHDWFDRALVRAVRRGHRAISWSDMEAVALHPMQLSGIAADLIMYRSIVQSAQEELNRRRAQLFTPGSVSTNNVAQPEKPRRSGPKPGRRKPVRDPVNA